MLPPRAAESGFTLIELMVVLAVIALMMAVSYPRFMAENVVSIESVAREVARGLRRERSNAMAAGESRVITLSDFRQSIPSDMLIVVDSSKTAKLDRGVLVFHPNGASSGARWHILQDDKNVAIDIDWLTGKVSIDATQ